MIELAGNIKYDSKSFYAYVMSIQKVKDKVGPLDDNAGNIVSDGLLMAENLNQFSVYLGRSQFSANTRNNVHEDRSRRLLSYVCYYPRNGS